MFRNVSLSVLFHVALVIMAYVGLPSFHTRDDFKDVPITVEIVTVSDTTNLPTKPKKSEPQKEEVKAEPKPTPTPPAPPPAPQGSVAQPPEPEPVPEPVEEKVAVIVTPEPKPKKEAKPKPEPKEEPKKTDSKKRAPTPLPPRKPKAPDQFASVLKTLEELKTKPREEDKKETKPKPDFASMMENALESDKARTDVGPEMTISEIDLVRQQIQQCWNLPSGAKDAHTMIISIRMSMNPDGTVQQARILDQARMSSDPFYRTMAESALRATLDPRCQPFKLPPEKYDRWKSMKLTFDPRDMLGL